VEQAAGKLEAARTDYAQDLAIMERLAKADPGNLGWQHDLAVSYDGLGYVLLQQNQRDQGLALFEKSRAIGERLVKLDSSNAQWKHDLDGVNAHIAELKK
jgi:hypothetical protein